MFHIIMFLAFVGALGFIFSQQTSAMVWAIITAIGCGFYLCYGQPGIVCKLALMCLALIQILILIKPLRRKYVSHYLFQLIKKAIPNMSATEREALEAGTVSWEGELFTGNPDFQLLLDKPRINLSEEEHAFLEGPVNQLCSMLDDWDITHNRADLPQEVWQFIKDNRFFGMIIPKSYGGLEFSATAQMSVLVRLYGHSVTAATTVSVPNSLGPGELLLNYGTDEQKNYYLPRLADGTEIPCFALTGPNAGSDAASIPDEGIVCKQFIDKKEVLGIRLNWDKRYITLSPVATVIGLAFRLFDPDNLLNKGYDIGISCALIPANTKGVTTGRRHYPLNTGFLNGPTQGNDVFISLDCLIGGVEMAGNGWRMLMECLSAGRAISLPSSANGGSQAAALVSGAYARIRTQFNQPIGKFEGIEEPLARIAANTYIIDSALMLAAEAIDYGAKPSVAGAILKYHTTERARQVALDAMDIHGGKGICLGPNNYLARSFQAMPIGITVEGANILTRSLIIFGQGAIRCHPYIHQELESIRNQKLEQFDAVFFAHANFIFANWIKSFTFGLTDAYLTRTPESTVKRYFQLTHKYSANLAFLTDFAMTYLGADLKRKEKTSARLGDILSNLYLASGVLKRFHDDNQPVEDLPLIDWCCQQLFYECDLAITGIINNFPARWVRIFLSLTLRPIGQFRNKPQDSIGRQLAKILTSPNLTRERLTRLVYKYPGKNCPLGRLEKAFDEITNIMDLERLISTAVKNGSLQNLTLLKQIDEALGKGLLTESEAHALHHAELMRQDVIKVDDFTTEELQKNTTRFNAITGDSYP